MLIEEHTLEVDGIQLSYNNKIILSDIYLKCQTGFVVGLLGQNGCGKSSLMQIMFGTHSAEDYSIRINNQSIKPAYKNNIAHLPQFNFIPGRYTTEKIFDEYQVSFNEFSTDLPEFNSRRKDRIADLSGGIRRLIELYVIIKNKKKFILLDEPFSHIMPLHHELIKKWIAEEQAHKGFLISDHLYQTVLDLCSYIYLLKNGKTHLCKNANDLIELGYING